MRRCTALTAWLTLFLVIAAPQWFHNENANLLFGKPFTPAEAESGVEFNFIAYGDSRSNADIHATLMDGFLARDPECILHSGDMVYQGAVWEEWLDFNETIQPIHDAGIPFYAAIGNHEKYSSTYGVYDRDFSNFTTFFDFPNNERFYSFDIQGVHFIFLNTEEYFHETNDEFTCTEEQRTWLISDLEGTSVDQFVVAVYHRPAFSISETQQRRYEADTVRAQLHHIFVQYDVDLVFNGHDHFYYRTERDGVYYVISAGGGAPLYNFDTSCEVWQEGDIANKSNHYVDVIVQNSSMSVSAYAVEGELIDSFTVTNSVQTTGSFTATNRSSSTTVKRSTDDPGSSSSGDFPLRFPLVSMIGLVTIVAVGRRGRREQASSSIKSW